MEVIGPLNALACGRPSATSEGGAPGLVGAPGRARLMEG
jgi:hypothetical protein